MPTLKDLREQALLSQGELAKACSVNRQTVYAWESGRVRPKPEHQRMLVQVLGCAPHELLAALKETKERRKQSADNERPAA